MNYRRATQGRRDGTSQADRRDMQKAQKMGCKSMSEFYGKLMGFQLTFADGFQINHHGGLIDLDRQLIEEHGRVMASEGIYEEPEIDVDGTRGLFEHCKDGVCSQCDHKLKKMCCGMAYMNYLNA